MCAINPPFECYLEVICDLVTKLKTNLSIKYLLKSLIQDWLIKIRHTPNLLNKSLRNFVMASFNLFVAGIPMISVELIKEASVLNSQHLSR